ncbi:MAG: 3-deoxy-manno-octulosonate cytidylyltransferase [Casimicrobiaceae bacterium]|nr:3-deoxy-manno-octulosonate cytidylyltransferase [Casimicrobiaceae bacterium]MDW8312905.1 3-deoxy-manno-octulosonate cytidylyltransferase [Burkholderiales bacterium]
MQAFVVVIPARYGSTRLPGKPLLDLGGAPMVVRVAERARRAGAERVLVATDDERIVRACAAHGVEALLTAATHETGTDRLAEVVDRLALADGQIVVNLQGDEPFVAPQAVARVAALLEEDREAALATLAHPVTDARELTNPNVVKVVLDRRGRALCFSRAPIPWARDAWQSGEPRALPSGLPVLRHVGLYAYRAGFLRIFPRLERPALERFESLEQLRALWHSYPIRVAVIDEPWPAGIDTAEDYAQARRAWSAQNAVA